MLKLLTGSAFPYIGGIVLIIIGSLAAGNYVQHLQLTAARANLALANQNLKTTVNDNSQDQTAIGTLQADLARWRASAETATQAQATAESQLEATKAQLVSLSGQVAQTENKDNGNLTCGKFLATDVLSVCPAHIAAERLRDNPASGLQGPASN